MTTAEAVRLATARGVRFSIDADGVLTAHGNDRDLDEIWDTLRPHKDNLIALFREHEEARSPSDAVLAAAKLLHFGLWPPTNGDCNFHCGNAAETCRRCGGSWTWHCERAAGRSRKRTRVKPK